MGTEYMQQTAADFLRNLDHIQAELAEFSKEIDTKSDEVAKLLVHFEQQSDAIKGSFTQDIESQDRIGMALSANLTAKNEALKAWKTRIEKDRKGREFMHKHEKYLVVMVFGAVKSGKSSLGNFIGGRYFRNAEFDNAYKHMPAPIFETEEEGRKKGGIKEDGNGEIWFEEGVTDTTGSIQYFTLSGLRWMDSPGTGAVSKEGDMRSMDEMVDEYISYADLCIFLMNSAEPGLQKDMRYMSKMSREGQDAIIVLTRSDRTKTEIRDGKINRYLIPKDSRQKQEDDVCQRTLAAYPNIKESQCRAISISTRLAKQGIENKDENAYHNGNIDQLMQILGRKAAGDAARLKEKRPRRAFNFFIDEVLGGENNVEGNDNISALQASLSRVSEAVADKKGALDEITRPLELSCKREIKRKILAEASSWEREVRKNDSALSAEEISRRVVSIMRQVVQQRLNETVSKIISDYEAHEIQNFALQFNTQGLENKTETYTYEYFTVDYVEREAKGIKENVLSFFGKKYYREIKKKHTQSQVIDMGTNLEDMCDELLPQLEPEIRAVVEREMAHLRDSYFVPQENYVKAMTAALLELKEGLQKMKFTEQ